MSMYSNRLQPALQNLLQCVVRFFHPRSDDDAYIGGRSENNIKCMTISGGRTKQLDIFCCHWLYERFSQFHSCGIYSVLSRRHSVVIHGLTITSIAPTNCKFPKDCSRSCIQISSAPLLDISPVCIDYTFPPQGQTIAPVVYICPSLTENNTVDIFRPQWGRIVGSAAGHYPSSVYGYG